MNDTYPWSDVEELKKNRDFWQETAMKAQASSDYYQKQLEDAHALLGRVVHQFSERWDSVNLTKYFPTDNLHGKRSVPNPKGENL